MTTAIDMGVPPSTAPEKGGSGSGNTTNPAITILRSLTSLSNIASISGALSTSVPGIAPHTETAKLQVSALWTSAKPWNEFFNGKKFLPPTGISELQERLMDNLTYFSSNYLICFLAMSTLSVLIHPLSFLCLFLLAGLYIFMFLQNQDVITIGPVKLSANGKKIAFAIISFILLYITNAIGIIGSWALFGIILSLVHAGCRVSAKEPDFDSPVNPV